MKNTFIKNLRIWLGRAKLTRRYREIRSSINTPKYIGISNAQGAVGKKSVVFLCPANNIPIGGVKVIFNQASLISSLNGPLSASVLHPTNTNFKCTWFNHDATYKLNLRLNTQNDFVMIPEFWVVPHARLLHAIGIKYGIYVQNGYSIAFNTGDELDAAYKNAALILGISDDTVECIKLAYPECSERVHRVHCSVNPDKFSSSAIKENIICYMPRKLVRHSKLVTFFLSKKIPLDWKIVSIDGLDENGVAAILGKSKIFLSFSELEGLSLPPIEAALSGCQVVGYTGEAAKEYWDKEIFTEIYAGDIKAFVKSVLSKVVEIDSNPTITHVGAIKRLAGKYSAQIELDDMRFVSSKVVEILNLVEHRKLEA
jgi:hypothetical protein